MSELSNARKRHNFTTMLGQRGVVVPIVVIGLLALLAVAGLALDGSHALGNKTRMQNTVDAAALAAAKVLDETDGDTALATAAANSLVSINASSSGNHEMNDAYGAGDIGIAVQYSATLDPFVPGSFVPGLSSWFVRVIATGFDTQTTLSRVLGINEISTPATAVAGPSGPLGAGAGAEVCDVAPIAVCEDDVPVTNEDDPNYDSDAEKRLRVLKPAPSDHDDVGSGNYKMLRLYDSDGNPCNGGDCLRENMAGAYDGCVEVDPDAETPPSVETEPGVSSGPVSQGFNTRFDELKAGLTAPPYPPDKDITEQDTHELKSCQYVPEGEARIDYIFLTTDSSNNYCKDFGDDFDPTDPSFDPTDPSTWPESDYKDDLVEMADEINYNYCNYSGHSGCQDLDTPSYPDGSPEVEPKDPLIAMPGRRVLQFPVVKCDSMANGQSTLVVQDVACFFMLQSLEGGQADGAGHIFGQYIGKCDGKGNSGSIPGGGTAGPLLYKIQLYKDPDSKDS